MALGFATFTYPMEVVQVLTFLKVNDTSPILSIGWTLEYEFVFYSICALSLLLFKSLRMQYLFVILSLVAAVIAIDFVVFSGRKYGHFAELLFGALIYLGFRALPAPRRIPLSAGLATGALALAGFWAADTFYYQDDFLYLRFVFWGIPSALLVAAAILLEGRIPRASLGLYLGAASYAIYISHTTTIHALYALLDTHRGESLVVEVLAFLLAIVVGCLVHSLIEKPIAQGTHWMQDRLFGRASRGAANLKRDQAAKKAGSGI